MRREAEKFAEEDKKRREEIQNRNSLEQLVYATRKSLEDYGDKIPQDIKDDLENEVKRAEEILNKGKPEEIKEELDILSKKIEKIGQAIYQQAPQQNVREEENEK